jgi:Flp pilus assembly pilin Flp
MKTLFTKFVRDEEGQDLIEYGLLIGIITTACVAAISGIGGKVVTYYTGLAGALGIT